MSFLFVANEMSDKHLSIGHPCYYVKFINRA